MTIISITRQAKCKDCKQLKRDKKGDKVQHRCIVRNEVRTLKDIPLRECFDNGDFEMNMGIIEYFNN